MNSTRYINEKKYIFSSTRYSTMKFMFRFTWYSNHETKMYFCTGHKQRNQNVFLHKEQTTKPMINSNW